MTAVLITIDTELSPALHQRGASVGENLASSVFGAAGGSAWGIGWQMDAMERHGLTGVFFVDPLPALVYGDDYLRRTIDPILCRGHEVQLHAHTEWLAWAPWSPAAGRQGRNLADFTAADQHAILAWAAAALVQAGAPFPTAFRAGNYGADDRTLAALAALSLTWDSSFNAAYRGSGCAIDLPADTVAPVRRHGIVELPVASLHDVGGHVRPAQVCAVSRWEMAAALRHAAGQPHAPVAIVCHSFEMLTRDRRHASRTQVDRFEAMCATIAATPGLAGAGFRDLDPAIADQPRPATRLAANPLRTAARMGAQAVATLPPWVRPPQPHPARALALTATLLAGSTLAAGLLD